MKILDVYLHDVENEDLNLDNDSIFIIRDKNDHINGRREALFDYDASISTILNKCAEFSDADFIHCKIFNWYDLESNLTPDLNYYDIFTYDMKIDGIDVCAEIFIRTSVLKTNRFDEMYDLLFINELKNRCFGIKHGNAYCTFPTNETKNYFVHLEYETLLINNELKNKCRKNVIYTFSNSEKQIPKIRIKNDNFDYICFTEKLTNDVGCWKMFNTSFDKMTVKICPHYFFKNYEISLWVENSVTILSNLNDYINLLDKDNYILAIDNDKYDCVYDILKNEKDLDLCKYKVKLILDKYPIKNGLIDSYALLRRHNVEECKEMMNEWLCDVDSFGISDTFCFNYSLWKKHGKYLSIPFEIANQRFLGRQNDSNSLYQ